jgi:hypothetical protein
VDTNAVKQNSTTGIYMVDNRLTSGSQGEGSVELNTHVSKNSNVCIQVINIDATSDVTVTIESVGNSNAWGTNGQPLPWNGNMSVYTGIASNQGGRQPYSFNVQVGNQTPIQIAVTSPSMTIS